MHRRVTEVQDGEVVVEDKEGGRDSVPFGTCVWATGIAMHPLVSSWGCAFAGSSKPTWERLLLPALHSLHSLRR